jgi:hypothetical protein
MRTTSAVAIRGIMMACGPVTRKQKRPKRGRAENGERLKAFRNDVLRMWRRQLNRRSQRSHWTWMRFLERLGPLIPEVEIVHPWPTERFTAHYPR